MNQSKFGELQEVVILFSNLSTMRIPAELIGIVRAESLNDSGSWAGKFAISVDRRYKDLSTFDGIDGFERPSEGKALGDWFISEITIIGSEDTKKFRINWDMANQNHNMFQRSAINKYGDLFIQVGADNELDLLFPDDVINAEGYTVN